MLDQAYRRSSRARPRWAVAFALAINLFGPCAAEAATLRVSWDGLAIVAGKTVTIVMPGGAVISGKATGLESDALLVDVKRTTDPRAVPKGAFRVPRATLHLLDVRGNGGTGRTVGAILGGVGGGVLSVIALREIGVGGRHLGADIGAMIGIFSGGAIVGHLVGNAIDNRPTTIEIAPQ